MFKNFERKAFDIDQTWLSCIDCKHKADLIKERTFHCPICGGLYEVKHRFPPDHDPVENMKLFDWRARHSYSSIQSPTVRSGVWRFAEWIMPYMPIEEVVTLGEGNVPIVQAGKNLREWIGDIDLHIIMEGMTPTGSFKDFGGTVLMSIANLAGVEAVACASTGDTSAMAAAYSAALGIKSAVILPKGHVTAVQIAQPLVHGAKLILLPGDFDDCMNVMQELVVEHGVYPANSLNPSRIEGHQATVFLIAQHFGWSLPDWIALPVGNGSNCSSVGKAMRLMKAFGISDGSKILGCQTEAANPLSKSWREVWNRDSKKVTLEAWRKAYQPIKVGETAATAARIGNPVSREKVMREITFFNGAMQEVEEKDLMEAVLACGKDGYFLCPQTGTALAGIRNAVGDGVIEKGERVVVISTATGLKFTDAISNSFNENIISAPDCSAKTVAQIIKQ